jgi:hypothetical protein
LRRATTRTDAIEIATVDVGFTLISELVRASRQLTDVRVTEIGETIRIRVAARRQRA